MYGAARAECGRSAGAAVLLLEEGASRAKTRWWPVGSAISSPVWSSPRITMIRLSFVGGALISAVSRHAVQTSDPGLG